MDLALFDFDGTITDIDTFTPFIHFAVKRKRLLLGSILLAPVILGYKAGIVPAGVARRMVAGFGFQGRRLAALARIGRQYANDVLANHIRPEAMRRIYWHRERGDKIVVVSASLDVYLRPWCDTHQLELISTRFEVKSGLITGRYIAGDCNGEEKVRRIRQHYDIAAYDNIYAYGDTPEDLQMLALADVKFYQWQQVVN